MTMTPACPRTTFARRAALRRPPTAYLTIVAILIALVAVLPIGSRGAAAAAPGAATSADVANPPCKNKTTRIDPPQGRVNVYYCSIIKAAYVYSTKSSECGEATCWGAVGKLNVAGYANWFVCQFTNTSDHINYARTMADNGKWGWVGAHYYSGTSSTWPLPGCASADPGGLRDDYPQ